MCGMNFNAAHKHPQKEVENRPLSMTIIYIYVVTSSSIRSTSCDAVPKYSYDSTQ